MVMVHWKIGHSDSLITKMIITISSDPDEFAKAEKASLETFVSEITRASRLAHHLVVLNRQQIDWMLKELSLSNQDKAQLQRLKKDYAQTGALLRQDFPKLSISIGNSPLENHNFQWSIGHQSISATHLLDEPLLLVENAKYDGAVITALLDIARRARGLGKLNYQLDMGGGGATFHALQTKIDQSRMVLCVCDRDMATPCSKFGETYLKAKSVADDNTFVGRVYPTPGREVENFLPLDLVKSMYPEFDPNSYSLLRDLLDNQQNTDHCLWLYHDIKCGFDGEAILNSDLGVDSIKWIKEKFAPNCDIRLVKITGFGEKVIKKFDENNVNYHKLRDFSKTEYFKKFFLDWCCDVSLYFLSGEKLRT